MEKETNLRLLKNQDTDHLRERLCSVYDYVAMNYEPDNYDTYSLLICLNAAICIYDSIENQE